MNTNEYSRLARRTEPNSRAYGDALGRLYDPTRHGALQSEAWLLRLLTTTLRRFQYQTEQLDRIKKAAFYGKRIEWTDGEIGEGHSTLGPFALTPLTLRGTMLTLPGHGIRVLHAVLGIATEAGELVDAVCRTLLSGKKLDAVNLAEEAGDVLWYVAVLLDAIGLPWEPVMQANILKLARRFRASFDGEDAILRDVDAERRVLEALAGATVDHGDVVGTTAPPARYNREGERETIDVIRDLLGDEAFAAYCFGQVLRYRSRAGAKDPTAQDLAKADWYRQMGLHVQSGGRIPDPRVYREGFAPYVRQPFPYGLHGLALDSDMGPTALLTDRDTVGR